MAQVLSVATNLLSLNAQRHLRQSQAALQTAFQRLSSGQRINSARDDAAGLAISERFTTQIRGLNQAMRNAQDGISLAQTAEGALGSMTGNLQRIRELAIQAANATLSASDRGAIDREVRQLLAENDRIATQTTFNGRSLLDGSMGTAFFQIGANAGQTLAIDLGNSMRNRFVGDIASAWSGELEAAFAGNPLEVDQDFSIRVGERDPVDIPAGPYRSPQELATAIDRALGSTGRAILTDDGRLNLIARETLTISGETALATLGLPATTEPGGSLNDIDLTSRQGASDALSRVDAALDAVNARRSQFGAIQNRFESTITNLGITSDNLAAARSRILDADYAAEVSRLVRAQILQQAGLAVLVQANALPQTFLRLLQ
ncbi:MULTISPECIES: flagellin [unclassified Thioalkalivibrio]|uniref:flagellin n=1 Tax=unclassified Thioalkalivibrio TaxID=2621013 RepID=UPI00036540FF|nr:MULTISPECIES: flagellin [unclassified Thioalkalivibrio]